MMKLVIADDENTIRKGLKALVESFYLDIEIVGTASDGIEALSLIVQTKPELILVDINMPRLNGLDLIEKIHEELPRSKVIIISGYDQFDYAQRALKLGVFDYLLKPVNRAVLYNTLSSAIQSYDERSRELDKLSMLKHTAEIKENEDLVEQALSIIQAQFSNPDLSLAALADSLHVSNAYLSRGIKQRTGQTFSDYLTTLRIEQAKSLLSSPGTIMIYSIADQVGYSSQHYFSRIFKEYTGLTPSEYRRKMQNKF